jgi:hypothetical protein
MVVLAVLVVCALNTPVLGATAMLELDEAAYIHNPVNPAESRLLLRFGFPYQLRNATIDFAVLRLTVTTAGPAGTREVVAEAFPTTTGWKSGTVAWSQAWQSGDGAWELGAGTFCDAPVGGGVLAALDATPIVQYWAYHSQYAGDLVLLPSAPEAGYIQGLSGSTAEVQVYYTAPRR